MKLICGLGNPGEKYHKTRHNAGFAVLNVLAKKLNAPEFKNKPKWNCEITQTDDAILLRPLTFMNMSGQAIRATMDFYKITPENTWIIYDDIDLPLGQIRIRPSGGAGTHNGMRSVIQHLNTEDFPRFRIGIESRGEESKIDLEDFVLGNFTVSERKIFEQVAETACNGVLYALKNGIKEAADRFNGA